MTIKKYRLAFVGGGANSTIGKIHSIATTIDKRWEIVSGFFSRDKNINLNESLSAYGVSFHRHNPEIEQMIKKYNKQKLSFSFTPHLSPMFRGILSTIYVDINKKKKLVIYKKN